MSQGHEARRRREGRKYRRLLVRYGPNELSHQAFAMQISTRGLFLSTNAFVCAKGTRILIEIKGPAETWVVHGVVRHAWKVDPSLAGFSKPGMGVELLDLPPAARDYLASL